MTYEIRKLHEVFTIKKGRKPNLHAVKKPGDVPYLIAKVMRGAQEPEWVRRDDPNVVHVTEDEAIIICDGSNSGEVFSGFSGALSSTMAKIEPKIQVDQVYLRRFLESNAGLFAGTKTGAAIPHLDQDAMFNLEIPLPPLAEQQRIVRLLDEAFEGIAIVKVNAEKNLQNARALFESRLHYVYTRGGKGWTTKALGEVLERTESVNPLRTPNEEFEYIDVSSVSNVTFDIQETQRLQGKDAPSRARKLVREDDIIFATVRPTLQRIAVVPEHLDKQICSTGYVVLRPQPGVSHRFLFHSLFTPQFKSQMETLQRGASYPAVTDSDVRNQYISIPNLAEQADIARALDELSDKTRALASAYIRKITALESLKSSLLDRAFSGHPKAA